MKKMTRKQMQNFLYWLSENHIILCDVEKPLLEYNGETNVYELNEVAFTFMLDSAKRGEIEI